MLLHESPGFILPLDQSELWPPTTTLRPPFDTPPTSSRNVLPIRRLEDDARITNALITFEQVHLLGGNLPVAIKLSKPMSGPPRQNAGFVIPELMDLEIRPDHPLVIALAGHDFDIGHEPDGA